MSDTPTPRIKLFHICKHCNKEYELALFRHTFSDCPHCGKRDDVWVRVETNHEQLERELADMTKQRDDLQAELDKANSYIATGRSWNSADSMIAEATKQRDALASLLKDCRPFCEPMRQRMIDEALAATCHPRKPSV